MKLYPTPAAAHLATTATAVVAGGLVMQAPMVVGWGGAVLVALALARAATLLSIARIRAAGFEMLWSTSRKLSRTTRGAVLELEAEVRNRDTLSARYVRLRAVASSSLRITIEPAAGEVVANSRLRVKVRVQALRVGQHGIHGLALEVHGAPGLFEVPLTFANPIGVEVLPRAYSAWMTQPRGGRSRLVASAGRAGRARGEGNELRELRELVPGDSFRRIAWKASARRGRLLVKEYEREERDVVWVVLDSALELTAGPVGRAPLDLAIDDAMAVASRHLGRGDRVGLLVTNPGVGVGKVSPRAPRVVIRPDEGPEQAHRIAHALSTSCAAYDTNRSDLDEAEVAVRVLEHLRPLHPTGLADLRRGDLDAIAARAESYLSRAPFPPPQVDAPSVRERSLRRYLGAYGLDAPASSDRTSDPVGAIAQALTALARTRPRPSLVYVLGTPPEPEQLDVVASAVRALRRQGASVEWSPPSLDEALSEPWDVGRTDLGARFEEKFARAAPFAAEAVGLRARLAQHRRERALRSAGAKVRIARRAARARS